MIIYGTSRYRRNWNYFNFSCTLMYHILSPKNFRYFYLIWGSKERSIRKVMRRVGNFRAWRIIFSKKFPLNKFFVPLHEYFLELFGVHEFFSFNFHLCEYYFVLYFTPHKPTPNKLFYGVSQNRPFFFLQHLVTWSSFPEHVNNGFWKNEFSSYRESTWKLTKIFVYRLIIWKEEIATDAKS